MTKYWRVEAAYEGWNDAMDRRLEQALGPRADSGAGFGQRDMGWVTYSENEAKEKLYILQEMAKDHVPGKLKLTSSMTEYDDDEVK